MRCLVLKHTGNNMNLESQIKQLIIDSLGLEDITEADIDTDAPLFGDEGLGLDSVDALELGLAVQKAFGFQMDGEKENLREHFASVQTLADFIRSKQA
jgi:acyl carrier protein